MKRKTTQNNVYIVISQKCYKLFCNSAAFISILFTNIRQFLFEFFQIEYVVRMRGQHFLNEHSVIINLKYIFHLFEVPRGFENHILTEPPSLFLMKLKRNTTFHITMCRFRWDTRGLKENLIKYEAMLKEKK